MKKEFDKIYIATVAVGAVEQTLLEMGIDRNMIDKSYVQNKDEARNVFLVKLSEEIYRNNIQGNVAEAGVFRGDFASLINKMFPDKKLYLFDTFTGFDKRDIEIEKGYESDPLRGEHFKETSIELVMGKMQHKENIIIKQGYVPETLTGIEDEFCFVNLDMDLYKPTLEALRFFYPRIVEGGGILIHDYFDIYNFQNLKQAVIEFVDETHAKMVPIGDGLSVFILK